MTRSGKATLRVVAGTDSRSPDHDEPEFDSGMELISRRPREGKTMTAREFGALEFEPWKLGYPPGQPGPTGETLRHIGTSASTDTPQPVFACAECGDADSSGKRT